MREKNVTDAKILSVEEKGVFLVTMFQNINNNEKYSFLCVRFGSDLKDRFKNDPERVYVLSINRKGKVTSIYVKEENERKKEETKLIPLVSHLSEVGIFILLPLLVLALMIVLLVFALRH